MPIARPLRAILDEAVKSKVPHARLVALSNGRTPRRQHVLTALNALQKRHGLRRWSFHQLRHFFCSALVRHGVGVEAVRVLAGHADLKTTQRYVHANAADLRAAVQTLAPS